MHNILDRYIKQIKVYYKMSIIFCIFEMQGLSWYIVVKDITLFLTAVYQLESCNNPN